MSEIIKEEKAGNGKNIWFNCDYCDKEVKRRYSRFNRKRKYKNHFCSKKCEHNFRTKENHPNWQGGEYINSYGYKMIHKDFVDVKYHSMCASDGYIAEHRLVLAQKINRPLTTKELAHHIDGNKLKNNINNLKIVTKGEHSKIHYSIKHEDKQKGQAKLNKEKVIKIKKLLKENKMSQKKISEIFKIDSSQISRINTRKAWSNIVLR